jgi:hypothetical protein
MAEIVTRNAPLLTREKNNDLIMLAVSAGQDGMHRVELAKHFSFP